MMQEIQTVIHDQTLSFDRQVNKLLGEGWQLMAAPRIFIMQGIAQSSSGRRAEPIISKRLTATLVRVKPREE